MTLWAVRFGDGNRVPGYEPPANTTDPRAVACTSHRVGCDCREAMVQEDIAELVGERDDWKALAEFLLDEFGHDALARMLTLTHRRARQLRARLNEQVPF